MTPLAKTLCVLLAASSRLRALFYHSLLARPPGTKMSLW